MKINKDLQDKAIAAEISTRFKQYRIACPMTRAELAEKSMIKLLKALELEANLDMLIPDPQERPSNYIDNSTPKQRARKRRKTDNDWKWGDEE